MFEDASIDKAIPIIVVGTSSFADFCLQLDNDQINWLKLQSFKAQNGQWVILFGSKSSDSKILKSNMVLVGIGAEGNPKNTFQETKVFGTLARSLPSGTYYYAKEGIKDKKAKKTVNRTDLDSNLVSEAWSLGSYKFYNSKESSKAPQLAVKNNPVAEAINWGRDLINMPANLLNPKALTICAEEAAKEIKADIKIVTGSDLAKLCPLTAVVGAAGSTPPALIDISWVCPDSPNKDKLPAFTIVGKGVTFDTGGLNLKPTPYMRMMKKDMGGAAHALVLMRLIANANLPCRLRVLIPTAENSISDKAYRPGDVLYARDSSSIEVGNTDAEGRLLLADALILASEEKPDFILDFATLTGAARVALGGDIPALFVRNENFEGKWSKRFMRASYKIDDPIWLLPLWKGYKKEMSSKVANRSNDGKTGYGGAIVAALFLEEFLPKNQAWAHIDVMAWSLDESATSPQGGNIQGAKSCFEAIKSWLEEVK